MYTVKVVVVVCVCLWGGDHVSFISTSTVTKTECRWTQRLINVYSDCQILMHPLEPEGLFFFLLYLYFVSQYANIIALVFPFFAYAWYLFCSMHPKQRTTTATTIQNTFNHSSEVLFSTQNRDDITMWRLIPRHNRPLPPHPGTDTRDKIIAKVLIRTVAHHLYDITCFTLFNETWIPL